MPFRYSIDKEIDAFIEQHKNNDFLCMGLIQNYEKSVLIGEAPPLNPFLVRGITGLNARRHLLCFRGEGAHESQPPAPLTKQGDNYIDDAVDWVITSIRDAANNLEDSKPYLSYSKSLGVSLFKYCPGNARLVLAELPLNSMEVHFLIGPEGAKSTLGNAAIPMALVASKERLHNLFEGTADSQGQIYDIDLIFTGFTAEISAIARKILDWLFSYMSSDSSEEQSLFKRRASYQKDLEVVSTRANRDYEIDDRDAIDLLRFLYILCIAGFDNAHKRIWSAYKNGELGIEPFSPKSEAGLDYVYLEYLCSSDEQDRGRDQVGAAEVINKYPEADIDITLLSKPQTNRDFERDTYLHLFEGMESPWEFPTFRNGQSEIEQRQEIAKLFHNLKTDEAYLDSHIKVRPFQNDALFQKLMELFLQED